MKHNTKTIMKMSKVKLAGVSVLISVLVFTLFSHSVFADTHGNGSKVNRRNRGRSRWVLGCVSTDCNDSV